MGPYAGAPAYKAGIRPGDVIVKVDDRSTEGLSTTEVADMLHLHVNTVKRLGDRGELPFYRVCKRGDRRFRLDDVMRFLAQNR